jgi:hypothetical protein
MDTCHDGFPMSSDGRGGSWALAGIERLASGGSLLAHVGGPHRSLRDPRRRGRRGHRVPGAATHAEALRTRLSRMLPNCRSTV